MHYLTRKRSDTAALIDLRTVLKVNRAAFQLEREHSEDSLSHFLTHEVRILRLKPLPGLGQRHPGIPIRINWTVQDRELTAV